MSDGIDLPTLLQLDDADLKGYVPTKGPQVRLKRAIAKRATAGKPVQHVVAASNADSEATSGSGRPSVVPMVEQELAQARLREASLQTQVVQLQEEVGGLRRKLEKLLELVPMDKLLELMPGSPLRSQQPAQGHGDLALQRPAARTTEPEPEREVEGRRWADGGAHMVATAYGPPADAKQHPNEETGSDAHIRGVGVDLRIIHATPAYDDPADACPAAEASERSEQSEHGGRTAPGGAGGGGAARGRSLPMPYTTNAPLGKCKYGWNCRDPKNCPYKHPRRGPDVAQPSR